MRLFPCHRASTMIGSSDHKAAALTSCCSLLWLIDQLSRQSAATYILLATITRDSHPAEGYLKPACFQGSSLVSAAKRTICCGDAHPATRTCVLSGTSLVLDRASDFARRVSCSRKQKETTLCPCCLCALLCVRSDSTNQSFSESDIWGQRQGRSLPNIYMYNWLLVLALPV